MKFLLFFVFVSLVVYANPISDDCKFKGKKLYGEFQVVNIAPDIRVEVVSYGGDLRVRKTGFQGKYNCGEWYISNNPSATRIEFVNYSPDIRIEWSEFAGLPNRVKRK
ncbi:MAG: hypothetical protein N3A69_07640 [Leptospiraceae bacterium]|nr:hypothetical protein [Leptospiraceae bacterium]